ncbi:unnamed protein product, partial [Rotaria sp. Silwood1]
RDQLPQSLLPYQLLSYVYSKIITREDIYPQIFVNHLTEIRCVIILYSMPGLVSNWNLIQNYIRNVAIVCDKEYTKNVLVEMLIKCIPWNQKLMFCAIEQRDITPIIEQYIEEKKIGNYEIWTYIQFQLDKNVFMEKLKLLSTTVPPGIEIRPLKPEDAHFIIEAGGYKSYDMYTVDQIQFSIKKLCTMGAYLDGKLIGWRLLLYDGSFDMVYTLPEARRLGLASLLSVRLTTEMFKMQERVFGYTALNNQKSMGLAAKMGFHETGLYDWIVFEPNNISVKEHPQHHQILKSSI